MKILMFHNKYSEKGGEDTTVANEVALLEAHGYQVDLFTFDNGGSKITQLLKFLSYPFNIKSYLRVKKILKTKQPDLIHLHNFFFAFSPLSFWAVKRTGIPMVVTVQNFRLLCPSGTLYHKKKLYRVSLEETFTFRPIIDRVYRNSFFLTAWLSLANYLHYKLGTWNIPARYIFVSEFSKDIFETSRLRALKEKFVVKYNFMKSANELINYDREPFFVYIGRLTDEKGIGILIKSFETNGTKIKIIGDGPLRESVINSAQNYKNIEYLGFKGKTEILNILEKSKALIFPSLWFEGMPLTIIEALSAGTPVIASKLGTMTEMIIDNVNGLHFLPGDHLDLNKKIAFVNALPTDVYHQMITNCKQDFKNRFSDAGGLKSIINIYEGVIAISLKKKSVKP